MCSNGTDWVGWASPICNMLLGCCRWGSVVSGSVPQSAVKQINPCYLVLGQPFKSTIASCVIAISATMHSNHHHSYCSLPVLCLWWQHVIWTKEWILKANEVKVDFLVLLDGSEDQGEGGVILEQSMELGIHPKDEKVFEAWVGSTPCAWSTHTPWDEFQNFNNC